MNAENLNRLLIKLEACPAAVDWAKGKSLEQAWDSCHRADWMLWLVGWMAGKKGWPTKRQVVLAGCACARLSLKHIPKDEKRSRKAIEVAKAWAKGKRIRLDVLHRAAAEAEEAADVPTHVAYAAATYAVYAAVDAAVDAARGISIYHTVSIVALNVGSDMAGTDKQLAAIVRKMVKVSA